MLDSAPPWGHSQQLSDLEETGRHAVAPDARAVQGESFVVARTARTVLVEAVAPGVGGGRTGTRAGRSGG